MIYLVLQRNFSDKPLEWELPNKHICRCLIASDLPESKLSRAESTWVHYFLYNVHGGPAILENRTQGSLESNWCMHTALQAYQTTTLRGFSGYLKPWHKHILVYPPLDFGDCLSAKASIQVSMRLKYSLG